MSSGDRIFAGLDLGAHTIKCVIIAVNERGEVEIIGEGHHPSEGFSEGDVTHPEAAARAVRQAVRKAEEAAHDELEGVVISLSGRWVEGFDSQGMVRVEGEVITEADLEALMRVTCAVRLPPEVEILHAVPQGYVVDGGQARQEAPLGVSAIRLECAAHVLTGRRDVIARLMACCTAAGLRVLDVVYAPLAQAALLLSPTARELGVILLSMGEDSSEVALFRRGGLIYTQRFGVAGRHVTQDIKACLETSDEEAERLKHLEGCALISAVEEDARVEVPGLGGRPPKKRPKRLLCEIIEARLEETFKLIAEDLDRQGALETPGGLILTGGCANLDQIATLAEQSFGLHAALGQPKPLGGLADLAARHENATAVGLALFMASGMSQRYFSQRTPQAKEGLLKRALSRLLARRR
ncbi:cell division protein FtsA [Myxococcota bacterium]|nr:cell division protein FtsA [Myxococcota bacterium]